MGKKWKGSDKRVFVRHPTEIPIKVSSARIESVIASSSKDVSQGGISFQSEENFAKGEIIEITIPFVNPVFQSKGTVAWSRKDGICYEIGVQFHSSGDSFRLRMVEQVCYIEAYRKAILQKEGRSLSSEEAAIEWIERFASSFPREEE